MRLKIGISPCPNDTYIYEALLQGLPDSPFSWDVCFADVQTLNEMVKRSELDVAKISSGVFPAISENYRLLSCGGAIGYSCGPLFLGTKNNICSVENPVLLPGKDTTAALLFKFFAKRELSATPLCEYAFFDEVYRFLLTKKAYQGVVIHEHRFTWKQDGLFLIQDLGEYWENSTGIPIPLGVAVARKSLSLDCCLAIENEIQQSILSAKKRNQMITPFIAQKAQIQEKEVIEAHIRTFVTDFSYDMGEKGRSALQELERIALSEL